MDAVKQERLRRSLSGASSSSSAPPPAARHGSPGSASVAAAAAAKKERVWVGVRIRPLLEPELLAREQTAWRAVRSDTLQYLGGGGDPERAPPGQPGAAYTYSRVFPETASSDDVYADAAAGLLAAAVRGYNGTVFAYGQTGSGKTHTMGGLMAAAAADVFALIAAQPGREFIIRLAALEIYNENVRDLLQDRSPALKLLDDPQRGTVADGLSEAGVSSQAHLQQLLREVAARRQTRATRMNDNSSRSHAIVRLYIESRPLSTASDASSQQDAQQPEPAAAAAGSASRRLRAGAVTTAAVNFVDLAGSERAAHSADTGEQEKLRQKEAGNIHKSLLTLSCVIRGLADNQRHLPYRDSKLTRLLQPYLSGNSHMAIITTISPAAGSADTTRAALHFATAAGRVVMRPQLNQVASGKAAIKAMAAEIQQLKAQLALMEGGHAALRQKEAEAAATVQERDSLRAKLQHLQDQILRGQGPALPTHKLRASLDSSQEPLWRNRVAIAKELRASSAGILSLRAASDALAGRDSTHGRHIGISGGGGGGNSISSSKAVNSSIRAVLQPPAALDSSRSSPLLAGVADVRRSMRLLNCYLPRGVEDGSGSPCSSGQLQPVNQQPQQQQLLQQRQQQLQQPGFQSILQQAAPKAQQQQQGGSRKQQQAQGLLAQRQGQGQQQQQQQQGSMLNPSRQPPPPQSEEVLRALQMEKLQEPSGPEAEAAMAGLEVEVRCYQHVREYTLGELSAALEHLESQAAAGQGTGSWSSEQLEALRSEVARKRAAEALTQLGDRALDALARKVNSYTSSADNSPFCDAKRALRCTSGSGAGMAGGSSSSRDVCLLEAALESAAAAAAAADGGRPSSTGSAAALDSGPSSRRVSSPEADGDAGSWPEVGPRLMSGRTTPTASTAPSSRRGSKTAGGPRPAASITAATPAAPATPALSATDPAAAAGVEPQDTPAVSAEPSSSSAGAGSAVTTSSRRHSSLGDGSGTSSGLLSPVSSAAGPSAQEQLQRMQEAWRESVEKDVTCLREVLGQYKEQVERLEMQKKLLLSQVLKLEFSLEEEEGRAGQLQAQAQLLQQQLAQAARERDAARAAAAAATAAAAAATAAAGPGPAGAGSSSGAAAAAVGGSDAAGTGGGVSGLNITLPPLNTQGGNMAFFDAVSDDGWASTPTVDSLLPKIVALWDELYVPLAYRSRFFLCFRGRELFYYEVEARRLEWKRSQMLAGSPDDPPGWQEQQQQPGFGRRSFGGGQGGDGASTPTAGGRGGGTTPRPLSAAAAAGLTASSSSLGGLRRRSRELDRAARALDWERKSLAAGLKWNLTEAEREELYRAWGVDPDTKERKLQLVFKLWSKEALQAPDGMQRSSELVVMLCGMDASEHMMELVFGSHLREYGGAGAPGGCSSSNGLGMALTNVVRRLAPPLSRAGAIGGSPLRSSMASANGGFGGGGGGYGGFPGGGPIARAGGSFTSKLGSGFMSLLGSRERSHGQLSSAHLAGMGGGSLGPASREGSFSSLASSVMPGRQRH